MLPVSGEAVINEQPGTGAFNRALRDQRYDAALRRAADRGKVLDVGASFEWWIGTQKDTATSAPKRIAHTETGGTGYAEGGKPED